MTLVRRLFLFILVLLIIPISAGLSLVFYYLAAGGILGFGLYQPDVYGSIEPRDAFSNFPQSILLYVGVAGLFIATSSFFVLLPSWAIKVIFKKNLAINLFVKIFIISLVIISIDSLLGKLLIP